MSKSAPILIDFAKLRSLAAQIGVKPSYISDLKRDPSRMPSLPTALKMQAVAGVDPNAWLERQRDEAA